ncbi:hypothetical protein [Candidatus Magnetomonas plexicatena]|uniref:hypothetical protein n=1 Tax=Candidatus Magnetomonas plexicatena TaxID=2552947 RepID=UPI001C77FC08|nr:hypothetical protein E2O03_009580 [Nitrospirales bacterium LBB_01]
MSKKKKYIIPFLLIIVFLFTSASLLYSDDKVKSDTKEGYVGAETCKGCHPENYEAYKKSVHGKPSVKGPGSKDACETCHGSGAKHVEKGGGRGVDIFSFADKKVDAKEKSAKCLACHQENKSQVFWSMSKHSAASSGVSCDSCIRYLAEMISF